MTSHEAARLAPAGRVIRAKVRPPVREGWVERSRPESVLEEALESRRVVVVSATAGAGKTTLVAAVARRLACPVAWLTLDWTDNAPGRLVTYLEAALATAVPGVDGIVRDASAARIPHPEAAGLLLEATAGERVVLVVDELERLGPGSEAWAVLEALVRHAPSDMRLVLCSRRPVPASVLGQHPGEVARLGDEVLALTAEEAASVLAALDRPGVDPAAAVQATGGWMTGVLFEAWRVTGGGSDDPLDDYLSAHILGGLPEEDREFLIVTSVLEEVTAARATALGVQDAGARLASLRTAHIPAVWTDSGRTLRCHACLREHLQDRLESWAAERLRALRVAYGRLLAAEERYEDATDVLLGAGAAVEALEPAARAIFGVIDRLDFRLAQRWLDALADVEPDGMSAFVVARLELAIAGENPRLGVELADRLAARGKLAEVLSSSSVAAMMLGQCYLMVGRCDDMLAVCALAPDDPDHGRRPARERPSVVEELLDGVEEARFRLRVERDPASALTALQRVERHAMTHRIGFLAPTVDLWSGLALLHQGRGAEALERLRRAVASLRRTRRWLEMPGAAVYLAEAEWRMGNEDAADQAADLALEAARAQGFNHMLLLALRDFPAVLSRRLDAEPVADSPWHELGRALRAHGVDLKAPVRASVRLVEFGRCAILVDGEETRPPRIAKTYELLAYLLSRPDHRAGRTELLDALFDGRSDDSSRSYLRQAVRWLRAILPPAGLVTEQATIAITDQLAAVSESVELERALAQAAGLRGAARLDATLTALQVTERGPYLPGVSSCWVEERSRHLRELTTDARYDAADLALASGRLEQAGQLTEAVLEAEPHHEPAWRLAMRLASAQGHEQGVLRAYRRCDQILAEVGAEPSATTRRLVNQLRR